MVTLSIKLLRSISQKLTKLKFLGEIRNVVSLIGFYSPSLFCLALNEGRLVLFGGQEDDKICGTLFLSSALTSKLTNSLVVSRLKLGIRSTDVNFRILTFRGH